MDSMRVCDPDRDGLCNLCSVDHPRYCPDRRAENISPNHYSRFVIEPIDFIERNNLGFAVGNVVKYVCRFDAKNGLEDLKKAQRYIEFLIAKANGQAPSTVNE